MKIGHRKSKRITCAHRYRVEKKQRERLRKRKRDARKNPIKPRNPDKDLRVPNSAPFKERVLQEAMEVRAEISEAKQMQRIQLRAQHAQEKFNRTGTGNPQNDDFHVLKEKADNSAHSFVQEFNKVVDQSDIVVQVLDARDPLGTRCKEVEKAVIKSGKRLILLINKCDLIPAENLKSWLVYLRKELPTLPFKASTQSQKNKLSQNRGVNIQALYEDEVISNKRCLGAQHLMKLFGNYCRNKDIKTSIKVGIVGYPNVGKSSVINSLKRSKACTTGATPGLTRQAQVVTLDKHVQLVDSPGVIFDKSDATGATLRNARRVEALTDPVAPALEILKRANKQQLMLQYKIIEEPRSEQEFLALLARVRGFVARGGVYNPDQAARLLLNDWNAGKIKYYTVPPEETVPGEGSVISTEIVETFAKEFDLDFDFTDKSIIRNLPKVLPSDTVQMEVENEEEPQTMETVQTEIKIQAPTKAAKKDDDSDDGIKDDSYNNLRQNKKMKNAFKKVKKMRKKADKISTGLADSLESAFSGLG